MTNVTSELKVSGTEAIVNNDTSRKNSFMFSCVSMPELRNSLSLHLKQKVWKCCRHDKKETKSPFEGWNNFNTDRPFTIVAKSIFPSKNSDLKWQYVFFNFWFFVQNLETTISIRKYSKPAKRVQKPLFMPFHFHVSQKPLRST